MADAEKMAIKERLGKELETIQVKLEKRGEKQDCADLVNDIGNVSQSILMELDGTALHVPTPNKDELPEVDEELKRKGFTKAYANSYLQEVKKHLANS